jgi:DNA-binding transcriptional LysR family regulator
VRERKLRVLLRGFIGAPTPVSVVYLPGRQHSPRVRWFTETLREMIPSPAPWEAIARRR